MCTLIGSRQILNKRPHVRGLAHLRGVHVSSVARAARRRFSESTATLRSETLGLIPSRAESLSAQSGRCQYSRRLRNCPIRHLESQRVATPSPSPTDTDSESIMVVRMACQTGSGCSADSYFTTYQQAASHYANSARCNQSPRGIATVVLPSRPTDVEAGGSGAAEVWAGPPRRWGPLRRQRISAGGDIMPLHQKE